MALDEDARKAVQLLIANPRCRSDLASLGKPQSMNSLKAFLNETDAERADYDAIIRAAADAIFSPGAAGKAQELTAQGGKSNVGRKRLQRPAVDEALITAPFRFTEIADSVVAPETREPVPLNIPLPGYFCGSVDVEWIAETPLLVGAPAVERQDGEGGAVEPLRLGPTGPYAIPGATLKGLLRSACEILGYGKLAVGNWHHRYGLRDFDHPYYTEESGISDVTKVKAGFLRVRASVKNDAAEFVTEDERVFEITPAKTWAHVPIENLVDAGVSGSTLSGWKALSLTDKYAAVGMQRNGKPDFSKTFGFQRSSVHRTDGREVSPSRTGGEPGTFLFAGKLPGGGNKKFEYAVFRDQHAKPISLRNDIVELFERLHSEPKKNSRVPAASWKDLYRTAEAEGIPIFYIGDPLADHGFFFGLTRLFKLPHKYSVRDILAQTQKAHIPGGEFETGRDGRLRLKQYQADFVESLFGYVIEPKDIPNNHNSGSVDPAGIALKGRLGFGFAKLSKETPAKVESNPVTVVQMTPRASFAPFYLRGKAEKDYSAGEPRLAGRKAYFPRYTKPVAQDALAAIGQAGRQQIEMIREASRGRSDGADTHSRLKFLMPAGDRQLRFKGRILLHNVSAAEIGLLLFAITHGGDTERRYRHMVGRAKPFGAGQMRVGQVTLKLSPNDGKSDLIKQAEGAERFDPETGHGFAGAEGLSIQPFLSVYETFMSSRVRGFPDVAPVREWLGMADPEEGAKATPSLRYQPLPSFNKVKQYVKAMRPPADPPIAGRERLLPAPQAKPRRR